MQSLSENIVQANNAITEINNTIRQNENDINTQTQAWQSALNDNNTKKTINDAIASLLQVNINLICSVQLDAQTWQNIINTLLDFQQTMNANNISEPEQKKRLEQLQRQLEDNKVKRQNQVDLKTAYQLQLRVAIQAERQRLEEERNRINQAEQLLEQEPNNNDAGDVNNEVNAQVANADNVDNGAQQ